MRKVYLTPIHQYNTVFYIGSYDPRKLVRMVDPKIDVDEIQEAQRPLDKKHLREIAEYASQNTGLLPASILIATKDKDRLKVVKENPGEKDERVYIEFPDTEEELVQYSDTIDIIDGQHRLFAFDVRYRSTELLDTTTYEMAFSMFITPELKTRQRLFTITNEKQKPVSGNLLLYLKDKLGMLNDAETKYLPIVRLMNSENKSPLKGRIVMSAEKISKGYKAKELVKILDKAKIKDFLINNEELSDETIVDGLSIYLTGWEEFYGVSFKNPGKDTITKISGLRYILHLYTTFLEHSINVKEHFNVEFVKTTIQDLHDRKGLITDQTLFDNSLEFRGEGATVKRAQVDAAELKSYLATKSSKGFNPFAG